MGSEVELKLTLEPADLKRLPRLPLVAPYKRNRGRTSHLTSTYYDTPDLELAKAGITVRIRSAGGRLLQTVKTTGNRTAGLFSRREWEAPVAIAAPDQSLLRHTGLPLLRDSDIVDRLAPVFVTEIARTSYALAGDNWQVDLALDHGVVRAGNETAPVSEAEFELVTGSPQALYNLARLITGALPARLATLSKSDRGYQLAEGAAPMPVKSVPVTMTDRTPVSEAFQIIARNCLGHALANERALVDASDPEAIHQMRVALRRLRSAIKIFRSAIGEDGLTKVRTEIGWLLDLLGPARDGQVFLAEIIDPVAERLPDNPALAALHTHWSKLVEADHAAAMAAVSGRRFTALMLDLGEWVEAGAWLNQNHPALELAIGRFAPYILTKCRKRLRKSGGKHLTDLPPADLHRVRILAKQMRYAGEFFASLYSGKKARPFLGTVAELQDALGALNDIAVARDKLSSGHPSGDCAWSAGLVIGWHEARRADLTDRADEIWRRLLKAKPFWN